MDAKFLDPTISTGMVPEEYECDYGLFFPFWSALTPEQQTRLAHYCKPREFHAGENIYFHQICNGGMYYVYEGAIRIYMISPSGHEATIYHRYKGQTGIILEMYENKPENIIPVFQAEQDSVLAYISKADLCIATQETPIIQSMYMNVTADCVQEVVNAFYGFAFLPLKSRVARILLERARAGSGGRSAGGAASSASRLARFAAREFFPRSAAASRSRRSFRLSGCGAASVSPVTVSPASRSEES